MKKLSGVWECFKGVTIAVIVSLICVLCFAFAIKGFSLSSKCIRPVNQAIKVVAVFAGCLLGVKRPLVILKGGIIGLVATTVEYVLYGVMSGGLSFGIGFLLDLIFGIALGVISATITGLFKRN